MTAAIASGDTPLYVDLADLQPPPVRVEVTSAQQRVLGQVPVPPVIPAVGSLLTQLRGGQPPPPPGGAPAGGAPAGSASAAGGAPGGGVPAVGAAGVEATQLERKVALWREP